jgi:predicted protein tyrosine phosphatase
MKNILFVCSANKDRSKTAEDYFSEKYSDHTFDSAGTNKKTCNQLGTNYIERRQLDWADRVYVMESKHHKAIKELYGKQHSNKIHVLNIRDIYSYGSKDLTTLLESKIDL